MLGAVFSELGAVFRKLKTGLFIARDGVWLFPQTRKKALSTLVLVDRASMRVG